jgi:hypothetical protein
MLRAELKDLTQSAFLEYNERVQNNWTAPRRYLYDIYMDNRKVFQDLEISLLIAIVIAELIASVPEKFKFGQGEYNMIVYVLSSIVSVMVMMAAIRKSRNER